jgi:predicted phosphodiesterase
VRAFVVSDLHSNIEALRAVMNRVRRKKYEQVICLGDFVGYGAQPNQVLDVMRKMHGTKLYIRGNHDRVAAGVDSGEGFNHAAKFAALWTRDHLSAPNRHFLQRLALGPVESKSGIVLCHGSPNDEDEYVFNESHARVVFEMTTAPIILYGHTHLPVIFAMDRHGRLRGASVRAETTVRLDAEHRYLINPGSVGQPRDRDPRAAWLLIDTEVASARFMRSEYPVEQAQADIRAAGLPTRLAERLARGI